ncbi:MAG: hypothetical protein ACUVSV_05315 [Armatimonadota bacterium]
MPNLYLVVAERLPKFRVDAIVIYQLNIFQQLPEERIGVCAIPFFQLPAKQTANPVL